MTNNPRNITADEKVCFNCQYMSWLVAIGLGVRCTYEYQTNKNKEVKPKLPLIPYLRHTCEKFEYKKQQEDEQQS